MLTREQIYTLFTIRNREENVISPLPNEVIEQIANVGFDPNPDSDIARLLNFIAYGNLTGAKHMLDKSPALIGKASHVYTPSGLHVRYVKPYECALGGGDPEMAEMIAGYFDQFTDGAEEKAAQDAKYRQHIEDMLIAEKNPPYDFTLLIQTLMAATPEDVAAALNLDFTHDSALRDVLAQFRKDFTPGTITRGMHVNHLHLMRAFEVYDQYFEDLADNCGGDYGGLRLFCSQVIGFIQRSLPAIDRMAFAQGLHGVVVNKNNIERSFKFRSDRAGFPVTGGDSSCTGLGYDCFLLVASSDTMKRQVNKRFYRTSEYRNEVKLIRSLMLSKNIKLAEFMRPQREEKTSRCVMLCDRWVSRNMKPNP